MAVIKVEKLIFGGQGLGRLDGRVVFVWGGLPGETVEIAIIEDKKSFMVGKVISIVEASPDRLEPLEDHYAACSPWQTLKYDQEIFWKKQIAAETFKKLGGLELTDLNMESDMAARFGYRNKMEYKFTQQDGLISLAFHERDSHEALPLIDCALAKPAITAAAKQFVNWLNSVKAPVAALSHLIIRCNEADEVIFGLYLKEDCAFPVDFPLTGKVLGWQIVLGDKILHQEGATSLKETVCGLTLEYGLQSFFQINKPIFEKAVEDIGAYVDEGAKVIDYYSGVGAISLPWHKKFKNAELIEANFEAAAGATKNIATNGIVNCRSYGCQAEEALDKITSGKTVIVDPPRAGLEPVLIRELLHKCPYRIIYLSCDAATQARDVKKLSEKYRLSFVKLYNFFPATPHFESLCVLDRKE